MRRNAINFVVRRHHALRVPLLYAGFKRLQEVFANDSFGIVAGADICAAFRLAVNREMLEGCDHMRLINRRSNPLETFDGSHANARNKVRVFTVGFFSASPPWVSSQIDNRGQALLGAAGTNFTGGRREDVLNQSWIPTGSQCNWLRIGSSLRGGMAVQAFVVEENWNSEPSIFFHPLLQRVGELRHLARATVFARTRHFA